MIYLLISNRRCCNKTEQIEKKDCRLVRQPLSLLPDKTKEYVESTKNEKLRFERRLAYTSLFCGLKEFFGVENADIERTKDGKLYLVLDCGCDIKQNVKKSTSKKQYQKNEDFDCSPADRTTEETIDQAIDYSVDSLPCSPNFADEEKKIYISVSHSDGVAAVCLSDEGEVGIDIQAEQNSSRTEKLNERFFPAIKPENADIKIKCFICSIDENEAMMEEIELCNADLGEKNVKWAYCESIMKLSGGGFRDVKNVSQIADRAKTTLKKYVNENATFTVALTIFK